MRKWRQEDRLRQDGQLTRERAMTAHDLIKILENAGFVAKEGAKHTKLMHPDGRVTVVHRHKGDIPKGTLRAIARETCVNLI